MADGATDAPRLRYTLALASACAGPFAFRIASICDRAGGLALQDLRGFLSDAALALLALAILLLVSLASRLLAVLLVLIWTLLQYANYETVRVLGSLASSLDVGFLADPTFLLGSATAISRPVLLTGVLAASAALAWGGLRGVGARHALGSGVAAALLLGAHTAWPWQDDVAAWRQTHFIQRDARLAILAALGPGTPVLDFPDPPAAMLDRAPGLAADLGGPPLLPLEGRGSNVLLVVLESVSGAYLPSLAEWHGQPPATVSMPELDAIARANLGYSTFFTHQRKTNRGLYALLCGELPNLMPGLPKMSDAAQAGWRSCLPEVLRDAGYQTVYLQAAPLAFMLKDQFMPEIGFARVHGHDWFQSHYARSAWGVDDRAFLEQSIHMIEALEAGEKPWFLTLLTVGTHHPYVVPPGFRTGLRAPGARSLAYLDLAIGDFVRRIEELGIPDDTLVLITSDESAGIRVDVGAVRKTLSQNWGFLIVRVPQRLRGRVNQPFGQVDLPLSILDYLGLADRGGHFFGRSVFRRYHEGRFIFFANTNLRSVGALDPGGRLLLCMDGTRRCRKYEIPEGRVFGAERRLLDWKRGEEGILRDLAARSLRSHPEAAPRHEFALLLNPSFVVEGPGEQLIHGGQFVSLAPGEWLEVDLEVEARGPQAQAILDHVLRSPATDQLFTWQIRLGGGQTLRMNYSYAPERESDEVGSRSIAHLVEGSRLELRFAKARMTLHSSGPRPDPGVQVHHLEVEPH
jgi:arylsulfatase A-like enzyme